MPSLEERHPLEKGMKVSTPPGGPAPWFTYRRLVEKEFPPTTDKPAPYQLNGLQQSIYGVDYDADVQRH